MAIIAIVVTIALFFLKKKEEEPPEPTEEGAFIKLTVKHRDPTKPVGTAELGQILFVDGSGSVKYDWLIIYSSETQNEWQWTSGFRINEHGAVSYPDGTVLTFDPTVGTDHIILVGEEPEPNPLPTRIVYGFVYDENNQIVSGANVKLNWTDLYGYHEMTTKTGINGDYYFHEVTDDVDFELTASAYLLQGETKYLIAGVENPIMFYLLLVINIPDHITVSVIERWFDLGTYTVYVEWLTQDTEVIASWSLVVHPPPLGNEFYTYLDDRVADGSMSAIQAITAKQMYLDQGGG